MPRDPSNDFWWTALPSIGAAHVTPEVALRVPAVVDALNAVTQPIAHLPLKVFEDLGEGNKRPAPDHPAQRLIERPCPGMTGYEWRGHMQWNLALHHNAYARAIRGADGFLAELQPIHPTMCTPRRRPTGEIVYDVRIDGRAEILSAGDVMHLRALPLDPDGVCGISRVTTNAETIAHALAVQLYGARFFQNDGQAGGWIEFPGVFKDDASRAQFRDAWREASTGRNQHAVRVLEHGAKLHTVQINNEHAQFLETRKEMAIEIARIWNVPPHKIRSLERATFSNIEHQSLEFVTDTIMPWVALWEQRLTDELITRVQPGSRFFFEFNLAGLLRGDIRSRYQAYAVGRQWGWLSVNDIRRLENMNPLPEGDTYLTPLNMAPAGEPPRGDAAEAADAPRLSLIPGGAA